MPGPRERFGSLLVAAALLGCDSAVPILLYHHVGAAQDQTRSVSVEAFATQMAWLASEGYTPITASQLDRIDDGALPAPAKPVVISFDDGFEDLLTNALPILSEHRFVATAFVIVGRIGEDASARVVDPSPTLVWPEVLALRDAGVEIQSHSVTHPRLAEVLVSVAETEIVESKRALEARLGREVSVFAYPFGNWSGTVQRMVSRAGYASAHSVGSGLNHRFDRLRISIGGEIDLEDFARALDPTWWGP